MHRLIFFDRRFGREMRFWRRSGMNTYYHIIDILSIFCIKTPYFNEFSSVFY